MYHEKECLKQAKNNCEINKGNKRKLVINTNNYMRKKDLEKENT